jgi:hypothetical protein
MNLLEKAKEIIEATKIGNSIKYSPRICKALLDAIEEIESERTPKSDDISDRMFAFGVRFALVILNRHLEVKK